MCNKIKEDVQKSLAETLSSQVRSNSYHSGSQQVTMRENDQEMRSSIERYRQTLNATHTNSPIKSIKCSSRKGSAKKVAFNYGSSRSTGRVISSTVQLDRPSAKNLNNNFIKYRQDEELAKKAGLTTFSPFSTIKSRDKEATVHQQRRLKSKKALSKLDMIYKELQDMEAEH